MHFSVAFITVLVLNKQISEISKVCLCSSISLLLLDYFLTSHLVCTTPEQKRKTLTLHVKNSHFLENGLKKKMVKRVSYSVISAIFMILTLTSPSHKFTNHSDPRLQNALECTLLCADSWDLLVYFKKKKSTSAG